MFSLASFSLKTRNKDWEEANPGVKVEYLRQSKEEYRERLQSALARGEGPDVFRFHNTWLPMLREELAPLPPSVMSSSEFEEELRRSYRYGTQ